METGQFEHHVVEIIVATCGWIPKMVTQGVPDHPYLRFDKGLWGFRRFCSFGEPLPEETLDPVVSRCPEIHDRSPE